MRSSDDVITGLSRQAERVAGSDSERRATLWLAGQLRQSGQAARVETFWCRPNWALAQAWHVTLGLAGALVAVGSARVGGALILAAIVCLIADAVLADSPGRRLTRQRASQNLISPLPRDPDRTQLIITANLDAGRTGLLFRRFLRVPAAWLRQLTGGRAPGWVAWLVLLLLWEVGTAVARARGATGTAIGAAQLPPTVLLVLALALLVDQGTAGVAPGAGDNASGVAAAVALSRALGAGPPGTLDVQLLLQGAGESQALGLRHHLRTHRPDHRRTIVLGLNPCGAGHLHWWESEGQLLPVRCHRQLSSLASGVAALVKPPATPIRTRDASPALAANRRHIPFLTLGATDDRGLVPRSHTAADTPDHVDLGLVNRTVQFALLLVDALDLHLAGLGAPGRVEPAPQAPTPA
jgi:hypothetical protein